MLFNLLIMKKKKVILFYDQIKIILLIILICLHVQGCSSGGDYDKDLSGNYFYDDEGSDAKSIICHLPDCKNIYSKVISFDYNKDFIIAAQQPIYNEYKNSVAFELRNDLKKYPTNSKEEITQSEKVADSILKHDPYYQRIFLHKINYWIISHKNKQVFGPCTEDEYIQKRKELKVPDNLKLDL